MDPHLASIAQRLTRGLSLSSVDADLLRLGLEREWRARLGLAEELFAGEPGLLREELEHQLRDLWSLETEWAGREAWEWCAAVRDLRQRVESRLASVSGRPTSQQPGA
jgi:hypothetical protein